MARSLIGRRRAGRSPRRSVRGLLDLAKTLHMQSVAEGIELVVQLDSLRDQQCDCGQGFLFAKPLEEGDAASLITGLDCEPLALVGAGQIVYPDRS